MNHIKMLEKKTIIVTGTARGMGYQMLETFVKNGANVFACARTKSEEHLEFCACLAEENDVQVIPFYFDLRDTDAVKSVVKEIRETKLPIDGLVNNAGVSHNSLFQMTKLEKLREIFEVNYFAPYLFTQYITKLMVRNGKGSIVNISSTSAQDGNSGLSAYGSSKAALITMTMCIAEELGTSGIRANAICPGVIKTDMLSGMHDYILEIQKEAAFLKKIGRSSDVANAAMYLLSDYASYITGQVLRVDGGITSYAKRK